MAKIVITIEDNEDGTAAIVSWKADGGSIHYPGTEAEEIAFMTLQLLAQAHGDEIPVREAGEVN